MGSHKRKEVKDRVARISGHVRSVEKMIEEDRSYPDIVHQIASIRAALDSVILVIVDDLVEDCVAREERKEPVSDGLVDLQQVVAKMR